jgi:glutamate racemase
MTASASAPSQPIGVFDSGVGGLSILREIRRRLPQEDLVYVADQAHVPYGPRSLEEVRRFGVGISRALIDRGCRPIVVACNTASAAALHSLRQTFAEMEFVGMEPAVKPAAEATQTGVVGVLATPATFQGALFASVVERFGQGVLLIERTAPGLVERIEVGDLDGPATRAIAQEALRPILEAGADTLVLACTHYPFVIPLLAELAGPGVRIIDPAPAIARQTERVLRRREPPDGARGAVALFTTGDTGALARLSHQFLGEATPVMTAAWHGDGLTIP